MTDLSECKYRRFSQRLEVLQLHCFLKRDNCTHDECANCLSATKETRRLVSIETEDGGTEVGYFSEVPDPNFAGKRLPLVSPGSLQNWVVEHRPDLQAIRTSLTPAQLKKGRHFVVEFDGSIVYEQEDGIWEPPRDIKGYERDSDNPWRFSPLWPVCNRRVPRSYRSESCGCIKVVMKCLHSDSPAYDRDVSDRQCQLCLVRVKQKGE